MFASMLSFAIPACGCHITTCEHGSVCNEVDDEYAREDACRALCDRLVVCGNVPGGDHSACMSQCYDAYDHAPASTAGGCRCVSRASCSEISERQCPGAPPIGGGYGTGTGSTGTGSTTASGSGSGATTGTGSGSTTGTGSSSSTTGVTSTGSGAGGGSGSTTSGAGGQPGSGGAPGHDGGGTGGAPVSDSGPASCGD
jgi:hypothetical protein